MTLIVKKQIEVRVPYEFAVGCCDEIAVSLMEVGMSGVETVAGVILARWEFEKNMGVSR